MHIVTTSFRLDEGLGILGRTPGILKGMLLGLPPEWTDATEGGDSWSPARILAHLVHGEEVDWLPRARIILERGEERPFDPFDREGGPRDGTVPDLLQRFGALRERNLAEVRALNLSADDLRRTGVHPELGRVTLRQLLATWVVHDLGHVRQIARVMAKRYASEVGPWRAYLPVLREPG